MNEFEKKTKTENEVHLRETPELFAPEPDSQKDLVPLADAYSPGNQASLTHVTPPRRDGRVAQTLNGDAPPTTTFPRMVGMFFMIFSFVIAAIVLLNFNYVQSVYYSVLGFYDANNHHFDDAIQHYERAYYFNTSDPSPLLLAASIHLAKKEDALAFSEFDMAIKTASNPAFFYNQRGKILKARGRIQEAISDWTQAIKFKPNYYAAYFLRADAYYEQGKYAEALSDFDSASKADPRYTDSYYRKAALLSYFRRNQEALDTIKQAITIDPRDPALHSAERQYRDDLQRLGR